MSEFSSFPAGIMDQQGLSHLRVPVERKSIFKIEVAFKKNISRKMQYEDGVERNGIFRFFFFKLL